MDPLTWLFEATITIPETRLLGFTLPEAEIAWREIIGNLFGIGSAVLGMYRRVWTWPVGMIGNALLFTVFLGAVFDTPQNTNLYGQAGRQVFFFAVSVYGWSRWLQSQRSNEAGDGGAIVPRWASQRERLLLLALAAGGVAVCYPILAAIGSFGALADSWIFVGSLLATYGMARGYVEFWLIWIGVDIVGVPLLFKAGFYPSALLYLVYGAFVIWGFLTWMRVRRTIDADSAPPAEAAAAASVT